MMPTGLNSIVAAAVLARKLHRYGSSKYTSAYLEYRDFMRDIDNVATALQSIQGEVENVHNPPISKDLDLSSLDVAVDGVHVTLLRCEKLLTQNPKFQWNGGFITNIEWNFGIAEHVKTLQTRVLFHCTKINLVIQPLQMHIQKCLGTMLLLIHSDMNDRIQQVINLVESIRRSLMAAGLMEPAEPRVALNVPEQLAERFERAASSETSNGVKKIRACLDAIVVHFDESTRNFVPELPTMIRPTVLQYLNLMKCIWLLQKLRQIPLFDISFCQDTLSEAYVRQLERRVRAEFQRFEGSGVLQAPDLEDILLESDDKFEIWPDLGIIETSPAITEAHSLEIELFKAPLECLTSNRARDLAVFRITENRMRLAIVITSPLVAGAQTHNFSVDCQKIVLIPIYAHPQNQVSNSLSWRSASDDFVTTELPFKTTSSLESFQEAITNFGVVANLSTLRTVRAKGSMLKMDGKTGTKLGAEGHIQLWLYRRPPTIDRSSRQDSMASGRRTTSTGSSSTRALSRKHITKMNPTSTLRSTDSGAYLDPPIPAQLVLFTLHHGQPRIISIKIDENTIVNPDLCDCSSKKKSQDCNLVGFESQSGNLEVRIYDTTPTGNDEHNSDFNVAVLRYPAHVDARVVEVVSFKFVMLELQDSAAREKLCEDFETTARVVRQKMNSYNMDLWNLRTQHVYQED